MGSLYDDNCFRRIGTRSLVVLWVAWIANTLGYKSLRGLNGERLFNTPLAQAFSSSRKNRNHHSSIQGKRFRHAATIFPRTGSSHYKDNDNSTTSVIPSLDGKKVRIPPPISDTTPCQVLDIFHDGEEFYFPSPEQYSVLPKGDQGGFHIVKEYTVPMPGTVIGDDVLKVIDTYQKRNKVNCITLQNALLALDPERYPTLTSARKACRKGKILVKQQYRTESVDKMNLTGLNIDRHDCNNNSSNNNWSVNDGNSGVFRRGRVGDLVFPGDLIGSQLFLGTYQKKQCYPNIDYPRPQFELEVVYEDDHLAVVNKPSGIAVYSDTRMDSTGTSKGNRRTIQFLLPFVLTPPQRGTQGGLLRRPGIVHRLDKATSGLLVVAKTKVAMESLKEQFRTRQIQKLYTAIVNGDLLQEEIMQRKLQADRLEDGCDDESEHQSSSEKTSESSSWNVIDYPLGGKYAVTAWKVLRRSPSLNARDGMLTKILIRLHTGRYHQIRRHFGWWCRKPLVGDPLYAGLLQAHHFRKRGLYLCSSGISFFHPFPGNNGDGCNKTNDKEKNNKDVGMTTQRRRVEITIESPKRFDKLMNAEEAWKRSKSSKENIDK